jgi:hypothetical protein
MTHISAGDCFDIHTSFLPPPFLVDVLKAVSGDFCQQVRGDMFRR